MKAQLIDLAGMLALLVLAIVVPVFAGAQLERQGIHLEIAHPAIRA